MKHYKASISKRIQIRDKNTCIHSYIDRVTIITVKWNGIVQIIYDKIDEYTNYFVFLSNTK